MVRRGVRGASEGPQAAQVLTSSMRSAHFPNICQPHRSVLPPVELKPTSRGAEVWDPALVRDMAIDQPDPGADPPTPQRPASGFVVGLASLPATTLAVKHSAFRAAPRNHSRERQVASQVHRGL